MATVSEVSFPFFPMGDTIRDPYPVYDAMREAGRLLRTPYGVWIVHRYEDVRRVHLDHEAFSMSALEGIRGMTAGNSMSGEFLLAGTMLTADPPDHERLRRVVSRAFTPRSVTELEPTVRAICRRLLAPLASGEPFDIVADFAMPLPTTVIAELLGVPSGDGERFRKWSEAVTGTDTTGHSASDLHRSGLELVAYLTDQVRRRKGAPTDDLIGRMVLANEDEIMSEDEVVASCVLLLVAGNETTMRLITNMTRALDRHPEAREQLVSNRELLPSAVEEGLRYDSPVQMLFRGAKKDVEIAGTELPAGSAVFTMLAAANRDPDVFVDADRYDVCRTDNQHVSFGHGIHYCLGAPLARMEARVAFDELLAVAPNFEVLTADEDLEYPPMLMLRSPKSLVISKRS